MLSGNAHADRYGKGAEGNEREERCDFQPCSHWLSPAVPSPTRQYTPIRGLYCVKTVYTV